MQIGSILQLWRYPVKSMAGERLESAPLSWRGIPGDRGWAVFDCSRNGVTNAKRQPRLRACAARYTSEPVAGEASPPVRITLPDGTEVVADSPNAARQLGELLGAPVAFRSLGPAGSEAAERIPNAEEPPEVLRAMMGLLPGEPEADLSAFTPEPLRLLRQGNFFDAFPLHLLTRGTLRTLAGVAPESAWDERRFRPNVLLETEQAGRFPEADWVGRRLRVGTAVVEVVMGCPRCVVVTQAADDLPQDHRVMRTLVREAAHTAGVYARVAEEGVARVGDPVELL